MKSIIRKKELNWDNIRIGLNYVFIGIILWIFQFDYSHYIYSYWLDRIGKFFVLFGLVPWVGFEILFGDDKDE